MLNISITRPEIERIVTERIQSGEYQSAEEVVGAAHSLLQEGDELTALDAEGLRRESLKGAEQADRGEFVEFTAEDIISAGFPARQGKRGE